MSDVAALNSVPSDPRAEFNACINDMTLDQKFPEPAVVPIYNRHVSNDTTHEQTVDMKAQNLNGHDVIMAADNASFLPGAELNPDPVQQMAAPMGSVMDIMGACSSVNAMLQSHEPEPQQAPVITASLDNGPAVTVQNNWTPQPMTLG